jgi:hypothetical protein
MSQICAGLPKWKKDFVSPNALRKGGVYIRGRMMARPNCYNFIDKIQITSDIVQTVSYDKYRDGEVTYKFKGKVLDEYHPIPETTFTPTNEDIDMTFYIRKSDGYGGHNFYSIDKTKEQAAKNAKARKEAIANVLRNRGVSENLQQHVIGKYIGTNGGTRRKSRTTRHKQRGTKRSHRRFKSSKRKTT